MRLALAASKEVLATYGMTGEMNDSLDHGNEETVHEGNNARERDL
jgi:hypothetical protein